MNINAANPQPVDVPAPTAPRTIDDIVDAAVATLEAEGKGAEQSAEPEPAEPAGAADEAAEAEQEEKPEEGEDEDKPDAMGRGAKIPTRAELIARKTELRRREKELASRSEELARLKAEGDKLMAAIRQREEQARTVAELVELARQDPERAFAALAERAGMSEHSLYERITRRRLRDPAQREADNPELAELRAEIRAMRDEAKRREEEARTEQHRMTVAQSMEADVAKVMALADYPDRWPLASEWPTERLKAEATRIVRAAYEKNEAMDVRTVADRLERIAVYEEETRAKVRQARSKSPGSIPTGNDGRGIPGAQPAPKPAGPRRVVGNADNASTAARKSPTSFDERFALAVEEAMAAQRSE